VRNTTDSSSPKRLLRLWLVPWFLLMIIGMITFRCFGIFKYFVPVGDSVSAILFAALMSWKLRHKSWFWPTLIGAVLVHLPLIIWSADSDILQRLMGKRGWALVAALDAVLITAIIHFPDWIRDSFRLVSSNNIELSSTGAKSKEEK